jgi:4-amino-4-deoxy-L-arabinose transferase-like glycosyltransferase
VSTLRKFLEWGFCVWLLAITGRYVSTTWKTLQQPLNPGDDKALFAGWVVLCSIIIVTCFVLQARMITRGTLAICVAGALAIFVLSDTWFPALVAVGLLLICLSTGIAIVDKLGVPLDSSSDAVALAVPTGMAALALAFFTLSLAHQLTPLWIGCVLVTGTLSIVLQGSRIRTLLVSGLPAMTPESALLLAFIAFSALLNLTWAVAPEIQYDALNYHLAMPEMYLNAGGFVDARFLHAYLSKLLELLFAPALAMAGQIAAKLFVYGLGLCAAVATYALGRALFDLRIGMWAAALFYTTPLVGWLTGTVYIDNIVAFFSAAGLLMFVKWVQTKNSGWFPAICIVAGMAVGSKLSASFAFLLVLPVMAYSFRRQWKAVLQGCCAFLLIAIPLYALVWVQTGNPVFPLLNGIFKSPLWPQVNTFFNDTHFGMPATLSNLVVFPFRLTLDTIRFGEAMPRGALGLSLLLAFPFSLCLLPRVSRAVQVIAATALVSLILLFYTMQAGRYYVAILPVIAVIGAATALKCPGPDNRIGQALVKVCLVVAIVVQFPALTTQYWNIPERFPFRVAAGMEDRDTFARRALDTYSGAMHISKTATAGERVLGVEVETGRFYLDAPLTTAPLSTLDQPVRRLWEMKPGPELATAIRQAGFTRIFARTSALEKSPPGYPYLEKAFLDAHATLEFSDEATTVYRLR